jgi:hypothetical protein
MKNKEKICGIIAVLVIISVISGIIYSQYFVPIKTQKYLVKYSIGDKIAFDLDKDFIGFGSLVYGSSSSREIDISNDYPFPIIVKIAVDKNIPDLLPIEDTPVLSKEKANIKLRVIVNNSAKPGNFSGDLTINIYKLPKIYSDRI